MLSLDLTVLLISEPNIVGDLDKRGKDRIWKGRGQSLEASAAPPLARMWVGGGRGNASKHG